MSLVFCPQAIFLAIYDAKHDMGLTPGDLSAVSHLPNLLGKQLNNLATLYRSEPLDISPEPPNQSSSGVEVELEFEDSSSSTGGVSIYAPWYREPEINTHNGVVGMTFRNLWATRSYRLPYPYMNLPISGWQCQLWETNEHYENWEQFHTTTTIERRLARGGGIVAESIWVPHVSINTTTSLDYLKGLKIGNKTVRSATQKTRLFITPDGLSTDPPEGIPVLRQRSNRRTYTVEKPWILAMEDLSSSDEDPVLWACITPDDFTTPRSN